MKRIIIIICTSLLLLIVCWLVGQAIHSNEDLLAGTDSQINVSSSEDYDEEISTVFAKKWMEGDLLFDNSNKTEDNPWGLTAGMIDVESYGQCALLTPNTALNIYNISTESTEIELDLQFMIHPWVSEISDGVGVIIWYLNENDEILMKEDFVVDNSNKWQKHTLICKKEELYYIKIQCNNGGHNDDKADWLLISFYE